LPQLDLKAHLKSQITLARTRLVNDLVALKDKSIEPFGGSARAATDLVVECGMINERIAGVLMGGKWVRPTLESQEAVYTENRSIEAATTYLEQATEALIATIDAFPSSRWGEKTDVLGRETTLFAFTELAAMHMNYHDGQLNLLHLLYNDKNVYW